MKKHLFVISAIIAVTLLFITCKPPVTTTTDKVEAVDTLNVSVDTAKLDTLK